MTNRLVFLFLFVSFISTSVFAGDINAAFEALKNTRVDYNPDGAICEQLAMIQARGQFSAEYDIVSGPEYDIGGNTVGELDVLVVEKNSRKVVQIEEVKCWKSFDNGLDKAKSQKDRFVWNLTKYPEKIRFTADPGLSFSVQDFQTPFKYIFVSQKGGVKRGFDQELDFDLSEVKKIRMMLLKCQDQGACPKPL